VGDLGCYPDTISSIISNLLSELSGSVVIYATTPAEIAILLISNHVAFSI